MTSTCLTIEITESDRGHSKILQLGSLFSPVP